jgi:energy-coupling factor transporter ATP-binding protein EcfA2
MFASRGSRFRFRRKVRVLLKTIRVSDYRSIHNSNEFTVGPVTCLVGKNESGKSALLQALHKLNPDSSKRGKFDPTEEYPRHKLIDYESEQKADPRKGHAVVVRTTWELTDEEADALEGMFGPGSLTSRTITISKGYENVQRWGVELDEAAIVRHFVTVAELPPRKQEPLLGLTSVAELIERVEGIASPTTQETSLKASLTRTFGKKNAVQAAIAVLDEYLPAILYFAEYERMPGQVPLDDLLQRRKNDDLEFADEIFLALLDLAGTSIEEIQGAKTFEQFIARLEAVSNKLTREIFQYWSQNRHLAVEFRFDHARPEDPEPFDTGYIFRTRIRNNRHGVTVGFDERSTGFVWFFSFLVWFSQVRQKYGDRLLILLDEPGLSLHGKAQGDLLRYINEKLKPHHQVIYTTHSPFMVDAENLLGARTVEDVVTRDGETLGTKVGDRVLSVDRDTLFPLQAALGYEITQTLFIGKHTLLVEGPSDLLYLKWFQRELSRRKRTALDPRWTISPAGGIDKVGAFLTLMGGNKLHVAVLTDFQEGQKRRVNDLRSSQLLRSGHVFSAETIAGQEEADVEDIIGRDAYVELVNKCYGLTKKQQLPATRRSAAPRRVVKEVEDHFRVLDANTPEFDHFAPAEYLTEHAAELRGSLPGLAEALDRFEQLFKDLNALLSEEA